MNPAGDQRLVCLVCHKQFSQYTCPRCNLRYCSLPCYKSHSARCLESFHRDHVLAEMQHLGPSLDTRNRMMQTLKRFHERQEDENDDEEEEEVAAAAQGLSLKGDDGNEEDVDEVPPILSEATLNKLATGKEIMLKDLSPEEKKAFLRALVSGELSHMIKPWEPWWLNPLAKNISLNKEGNRVVQILGNPEHSGLTISSASDGGTVVSDVPPPTESPLQPLKQLTSVQPSPLLGVHLSDVLYSYCFTLRLYNGEWLSDSIDAAMSCLYVSQVLGQAASPETVSAALSSCAQSVCSPLFKSAGGYDFALALFDDTSALLHLGRAGVICALSDLYRLFEKAVEDIKQGNATSRVHKGPHIHPDHNKKINKAKAAAKPGRVDLRRLVGASKKVYFLLCWANEQSDEVMSSLSLLIEGEKSLFKVAKDCGSVSTLKKGENETFGRKLVIEEIT